LEAQVQALSERLEQGQSRTETKLERVSHQLQYVVSMLTDVHIEVYTDGRQHARNLSMYRHVAENGWSAKWLDKKPMGHEKSSAHTGPNSDNSSGLEGAHTPQARTTKFTGRFEDQNGKTHRGDETPHHVGQFWVDPLAHMAGPMPDASPARTVAPPRNLPVQPISEGSRRILPSSDISDATAKTSSASRPRRLTLEIPSPPAKQGDAQHVNFRERHDSIEAAAGPLETPSLPSQAAGSPPPALVAAGSEESRVDMTSLPGAITPSRSPLPPLNASVNSSDMASPDAAKLKHLPGANQRTGSM